MKKRGRPSKQIQPLMKVTIDFSQITKLNQLNLDPKMLEIMPSGMQAVDEFISHEGGIPYSTNIMVIGDPGVGKTTVLLDLMASIQNQGRKCLFISGEMGRKQMYKYTKRFPQFGIIDTLFLSDYLEFSTKDVVEQVMDQGYDLILIDSIAEVIDGVRDDMGWDRKTAESWLVGMCLKHNKGGNNLNKYTSFLLIQQVTKSGEFQSSNKLKHMTDATLEMRRESSIEGGGTYMYFSKNRNGQVDMKLSYSLFNSNIDYGIVVNM